MADVIIQGLQINLAAEYTENTAIGLYTVSGASYLRVSEAQMYGLSDTWTAGIIMQNGIGDIVASSDLSRGGNAAEYSGLTVVLANAEDLMQSLKDLQINLTGLSATITEFVGIYEDSDATSRTVRFTGVVENIKWGETALTINLRNSMYKREANLSTTNAAGVTTPVCFGTLAPPDSTAVTNLAKFVRTIDTYDEETYSEKYFTGVNSGIKIFPVSALPSLNPAFYQATLPATPTFSYVTPEDLYVIVVDGTGNGQIRQVSAMTPSSGNTFTFIVRDVFITQLSITGDNRSWVQFVKIGREYASDILKCKGFIKSIGGAIALIPELYTYDSANKKYNRIADFGLFIDSNNNNTLNIDGSQYSDDIDTLNSFVAVPISGISLENSTYLSQWNCNSIDFDDYNFAPIGTMHTQCRLQEISGQEYAGIYSVSGQLESWGFTLSNATLQNQEKSYNQDGDSSNYAEFSPRFTNVGFLISAYYLKVLKISLPSLPKLTNVEGVYLGIKGLSQCSVSAKPSNNGSSFFAICRRFAYTKDSDMLFEDKNIRVAEATSGFTFDNIADQYYTSNTPDTNNLNFYRDSSASGGNWSSFNGYSLLKIADTIEIYKTFVEIGLFFNRYGGINPYSDDILKLNQICIVVKLSDTSIEKEIFSPLSGRIFNDTFESRKTSTALIENPVDVIEHIKRLQNWSEYSPIAFDWGKEYAVTEDPIYYDKIRTGATTGSFDSSNLNYLTGQKVAMEITDAAKQTTGALVKKLDDTFGLCTYIDDAGYECIETLELTNPTETILLTDQIGAIGDIEEPRVENIFVEPLVKYAYDQGPGEYLKTLAVTHIDAAAWQESYTPGIDATDGEEVWNACKTLYTKYRQIEQCPSEFSDQYCIANYETALAYLKRKIAWMDKCRLPPLTVAYSKGKDYNIYKHIMVQLPVHTDNVSVECIIEKIVKSKSKGTVMIDFVILGTIENAWYDTSDSENVKQDTPDTGDEVFDQ